MPTEVRDGLNAFVKSLDFFHPKKLKRRQDGCAPHTYLAIQFGAACELCDYRSTSHVLVDRHKPKKHGRNTFRTGWPRDATRNDLRLQSWTHNGVERYWIVDYNDGLMARLVAANTECSPRRRQRVAALHEAKSYRLTQGERIRSATDTGIDDLALTSNWMRRTDLARTFDGADRRLLRLETPPAANGEPLMLGHRGTTLIFSNAADEQQLWMLGRAVDRFFDRCTDTALHTDTSVRCWLRSEIHGQAYKAPFELPDVRAPR